MLKEFAVQGVPVDCSEDWSWSTIESAIARGPHQSALTPKALKLFEENSAYQVEAGFAKVVLWDDIKHDLPSQLKVSPVAAVPHKIGGTGSSLTCHSLFGLGRRSSNKL